MIPIRLEAVVPGAGSSFVNQETNIDSETVSTGRMVYYTFPNLRPGYYTISPRRMDFFNVKADRI